MNRSLKTTNTVNTARRQQRGFTLVELSVVTSVVAVVVSSIAPSFSGSAERHHVQGVAAQLETDIQYARSTAGATGQALRISFQAGSGASCYILHTGAANACTCDAQGVAHCTGDAEAVRSVHLPSVGAVQLQSNVRSMLFNPARNTVTPAGTLRVTGRSGAAVHHVVNIVGRVRSCSPQAAVPGVKAC